MLGLIAQLVSSFSFGISNVVWKSPLSRSPQIVLILWRTVITCALFGAILLVTGEQFVDIKMILLAWLLSSLSFGGLYFFTKALKHEDAGIVSTITSFSYLIGVLTSVFIIGESIRLIHLFSLAFFIISTALLSHSKGYFKLTKGIKYALFAALIWGTTLTLMSIPAKEIGFLQSSFITELSIVIICLSLCLKQKSSFHLMQPLVQEFRFIVTLSILAAIGLMAMYFAFEKIETYKVVLISSLSHMVSIVFSRLLNDEKITLRLISAGLLASFGIVIFVLDELG